MKILKKGFTAFGDVDQSNQDVFLEHGQLVARQLLDSKAHVVVVEPIPMEVWCSCVTQPLYFLCSLVHSSGEKIKLGQLMRSNRTKA